MNESLLVEIINNLPISELVKAVSKIEGLDIEDVLNYLHDYGNQ